MRIFALETNVHKIIRRYCSPNESLLYVSYYDAMLFFLRVLRQVFFSIPTIAVFAIALYVGAPVVTTVSIGVVVIIVLHGFPILRAWLDWYYDLLIITSDKLVLIDQSFVFKQYIKPIHFENVGSISMETQWMNIFNFGIVHIDLKEGEGGGTITRKYVPNAVKFTEVLSAAVTNFQRGRIINVEETNARFAADDRVDERLEEMKKRIAENDAEETRWYSLFEFRIANLEWASEWQLETGNWQPTKLLAVTCNLLAVTCNL